MPDGVVCGVTADSSAPYHLVEKLLTKEQKNQFQINMHSPG